MQTKYNNIKSDWRKINDRRKNGSGKSPENEPLWFGIINPILCDTNKGLEEVVSNPSETSYVADIVNKRQSTRSQEHVNKSDEDYESYDSDLSDIKEETGEHPNEPVDQSTLIATKYSKLVATPHQKRSYVRSQTQAMSQLAASVNKLAAVKKRN